MHNSRRIEDVTTKEDLLQELSDCVVDMRDDETASVAQRYLDAGHDARDGIFKGLVDGMNKAAQLYEEEEYFIPELLICSDAMYNGLDVLRPHVDRSQLQQKCKVAIGVAQGDTHDIGKNLVKIMMEASGYEMIDLGRDVPNERFIEAVEQQGAQIVALSTLMSTSMSNMAKVIEMLQERGLRDQVRVIIGGGPISSGFSRKIGADGYSPTAVDATRLADELMGYR